MSINLIGIRQRRRDRRIVKSHTEALRIDELHILHDSSRQIRMRTVDAGVQHRDRHASPGNRQPSIRRGQIIISFDAIDRGQSARAGIQVPLESPIHINRTHRRKMRNRSDPRLGRGDRDHRQPVITSAAEDPQVLQISDVRISRQLVIDNHRVDVAVIRRAI